MTTEALAVEAAIQSLHGTLQVAAALAESGRQIELAGLDAEAARVCVAVGLLPPAEARPLRPALEATLRELDRVTVALTPPDQATAR